MFLTGHNSPKVNQYYLNLTPGGRGIFGNYKFYFNESVSDCDYVVVFEGLYEEVEICIPPDKVIFVAGEASSIKKYDKNFVNQFGHIITCQDRIQHRSKHLISPGHTWFSHKSFDEIINIGNVPKTNLISIVVSDKICTKGHRERLKFCRRLKDHFGDVIDIFGRGNKEFDDKWDVLSPYRYSVAIENSIEPHWITEKLGDCYTAHTFPFYAGAPNVGDYYNPRSCQLIDLNDFDWSVNIIEKIINSPSHYDEHLEFLKRAKLDYLTKNSLIPMICRFLGQLSLGEGYDVSSNKNKWVLLKERRKFFSAFNRFRPT